MIGFKAGDTLPKSAVEGGTSVETVPARDSTKGGVKPDILVQFRPSQSHLGKFGFDWLRMDDSKLLGKADVKYTDNVGHHTDAKGNKCKRDACVLDNASRFTKEPALAKKLKSTFTKEGSLTNLSKQVTGLDKDFEYRIPVMTLMPKSKTLNPHNVNLVAKLDTIIHHGKKRASSLKLAFNDKDDEKAAKDVIVVNSMSIAKNSTKNALHIKSEGILKRDVILYVYADGCSKPCGAIKILRNDKVKHIDLVFVGTETNLNSKKKYEAKISKIIPDIKKLRAHFGQARININHTKDSLMLDLKGEFDDKQHIYKEGRSRRKAKSTNKKTESDKTVSDKTVMLSWEKYNNILRLLQNKYKAYLDAQKLPELTEQTYVFYFVPEICYDSEHEKYVEGSALIGKKNSVYFVDKTGTIKSLNNGVLEHELGHCLGLSHTFEQNTERSYKYMSTDNFMDYYNENPKQFYYWQWKIMNPLIETKKNSKKNTKGK